MVQLRIVLAAKLVTSLIPICVSLINELDKGTRIPPPHLSGKLHTQKDLLKGTCFNIDQNKLFEVVNLQRLQGQIPTQQQTGFHTT